MTHRDQKPDELGGAINQLESLLRKRTRGGDTSAHQRLPILDEIVEPEALDDETGHAEDDAAAQAELENAMARLSRQMEAELETLANLLKKNVLDELRKEMVTVLGIDKKPAEQPAGSRSGDDDQKTP